MSKQGLRKTPTRILELRGSWRAKTRPDEPQIEIAIPACPRILNSIAKKEWRRVCRLLYDMGVIADTDRPALTCYCQAWSDYVRAVKTVEQRSLITTNIAGTEIVDPSIKIKQEAWHRLMKASIELGFTPSARASLITAARRKPVRSKENEKDKGRFFEPKLGQVDNV